MPIAHMKYILNTVIAGQGPPLVLIHGVAGSYRIWDPLVPYLKDQFSVIRVDLLGYGHSPKPHLEYTPEVQVTSIRDSLIQKGVKPPYILVGLSMGVNLALEFAARWPQETTGFIGIGFPYYANEKRARGGLHNNVWTRLMLEHPLRAQLQIPPIWWLGRHGILPAGKFSTIYSPAMAKDTLRNPYYAFKSNLLNCMVHNSLSSLLESSESLNRLFIHGSKDQWSGPADVSRAIQPYAKSSLVVLPNVEHNTVVIAPEITAKLILDYLRTKT
jgi:pimeloyl-ACP methyl ester carboxylesterase